MSPIDLKPVRTEPEPSIFDEKLFPDDEQEAVADRERRAFLPGLRSKRGIALLAGAVAVVIVAALVTAFTLHGNARPAADPVAVTVPVALSGLSVPSGASIGVLVTLGTGTTEGSEWKEAAQGAVIAQQRLALGGSDIELVAEDDGGTAAGAEEAVQRLIDRGVSGIVAASSGSHLTAALKAASAAEVPVVLPYAAADGLPGVWSLRPTAQSEGAALAQAVSGFARPLHVDAGEGLPSSVPITDAVRVTGGDLSQLADEIAWRTQADTLANGRYAGGQLEGAEPAPPVANPNDGLVISGHPVLQASIVQALQLRNVAVPMVLTGQATSPAFAATLAQQGGSVSPLLRTVGGAWDDAEALRTDGQGRAMSAFLAAAQQVAADTAVLDLHGDAPFAGLAHAADTRSHDAVLALAEALSSAGTVESAKVRAALGSLALGAGHGIAGPPLDFSKPQTLVGEAEVLYATAQELGLRPRAENSSAGLVWFAEPFTK